MLGLSLVSLVWVQTNQTYPKHYQAKTFFLLFSSEVMKKNVSNTKPYQYPNCPPDPLFKNSVLGPN